MSNIYYEKQVDELDDKLTGIVNKINSNTNEPHSDYEEHLAIALSETIAITQSLMKIVKRHIRLGNNL